jgi:hypothetical protein
VKDLGFDGRIVLVANIERADYTKVNLSAKNPFGLTFVGEDKNRSLFIEEPEGFGSGTTEEAQDLLRTVMLAHLIARYFPKVIETNFKVGGKVFLDELYKHYSFREPKIIKGEFQITPRLAEAIPDQEEKILYANAHSGGLDSVYRVAKVLSEDKKVMMIHIRNLNLKGALNEALASREQARVLGVPYKEIRLRNGSDGGFQVMKTRDMLLGLISSITAEPYGVKKVLIEGDMQTNPESDFSEYGNAWVFFNKLIESVGLSSQIYGMDAHDVETVGEVLKLEKELGIDLISLVQNCFTGEYQIGNNRRKWERETPIIAENSSYHWCGSCIKCRRMTLGRIFYEDPKFSAVPRSEIKYFVDNTYEWLEKYPHNTNLISQSFLKHLDSLSSATI